MSAELKWQPIETAPKDGTEIDVWCRFGDGGGHRVPDAYWSDKPFGYEGPRGYEQLRGWAAANEGYDGCDHWVGDIEEGDTVTHWMPRPAPPA
jgi:hypothetical protein